MRYDITLETTVDGDPTSIWDTWTDMTRYPQWDPREEELRLDGPFQAGTTGFSKQVGGRAGSPFTITLVAPRERFVNECPLPGGSLVLDHRLEQSAAGRVRLVKTYQVHGPLSVLFRLYFGREIRRNMPATFVALAVEAVRRAAHRSA